MSFASSSERLALRASTEASGFVLDYVIRVRNGEREDELVCDDIDHALSLSGHWLNTMGASYVEIFRVLHDGSLNPTLGPSCA